MLSFRLVRTRQRSWFWSNAAYDAPVAQVLLLGDEFHATLAGVRGLRAGGHVPYLAVSRPHTYASYSRDTVATVRVPDPDVDPGSYAVAVGEAAAEVGAEAVLPGTESALVVLSSHPTAVPDGIAVGAPPAATVNAAFEKTTVVDLAERVGLRTPPSRIATRDELRSQASELEYPVILKPARSKLATGAETMRYFQAQRIETAVQLRESLADAPPGPWVVQPYLAANLCAIGGVAWHGSLVCAVHQMAHRIWPPDAGYSSYAETVPADEQLEQAAGRLLSELQWSGVFQLQFIRTRSDSYFIDFNPRLYGSIALAIAAGRNLPAIWADLVLGKEPKIPGYRSGVHYRVEHNDARAILRLLRQGAAGVAVKALLPRRNTVHGIVSLRDPGPLRALLVKAAARVSSRLRPI